MDHVDAEVSLGEQIVRVWEIARLIVETDDVPVVAEKAALCATHKQQASLRHSTGGLFSSFA